MARYVLLSDDMAKPEEGDTRLAPLSKQVQFARALAGLPRVALGIAAGATLFTMSGCMTGCNGSYGAPPPPHQDAAADQERRDAETDGGAAGDGPAMATDTGQNG